MSEIERDIEEFVNGCPKSFPNTTIVAVVLYPGDRMSFTMSCCRCEESFLVDFKLGSIEVNCVDAFECPNPHCVSGDVPANIVVCQSVSQH